MILFFRSRGCPGCDRVQEALEDLCIAHETVPVLRRGRPSRPLPPGTGPPVLVDEGQVVEGRRCPAGLHGTLLSRIEELADIKSLWDKYQSDACYCDEEGNVE